MLTVILNKRTWTDESDTFLSKESHRTLSYSPLNLTLNFTLELLKKQSQLEKMRLCMTPCNSVIFRTRTYSLRTS